MFADNSVKEDTELKIELNKGRPAPRKVLKIRGFLLSGVGTFGARSSLSCISSLNSDMSIVHSMGGSGFLAALKRIFREAICCGMLGGLSLATLWAIAKPSVVRHKLH